MATLKQIIAEAKRIKKLHPKKFAKWTDYVKEASKKMPKKKIVSGVSKSKKLQIALKKEKLKLPHGYAIEKRKITGLNHVTHINEAKKIILHKIGVLQSKEFAASKVSEKNKLKKEILRLKKIYRKL